MKKWMRGLLILMVLCSFLPCACAEEKEDWISDHFNVELYADGQWTELEKMLYYSHENGMIADGFLMFSSILDCLKSIEVPTVVRTAQTGYRVTYDSYMEAFSTGRTVYAAVEDNIKRLEDSKVELADLETGKYLICISCNGSHRGEGYAGACFFWLIVE